MSAVELATICPECRAGDAVDLGDGTRLCLQCRHEWDPANPSLVKAAAVDAVLGPESAQAEYERLHPDGRPTGWLEREPTLASPASGDANGTDGPSDDWSGKFVRDDLHPERGILLVVEDDGTRGLELQDSRGVGYIASRDACTYLGTEPTDPGELVAEGDGSGIVPMAPVIFAVAGLALEAGVDAVGEDGERELYNPRIGWLPPPCDGVPEVEQGIAYAVAILIRHFDLDSVLVRQLAAGLLTGAETGAESGTEQ